MAAKHTMKASPLLLLACALAIPMAASAAPERLTVDQAVRLAIAASPQIAAARADVAAAEDQALSVRGRLLPGVHVSDTQQHYFTSPDISFAIIPHAPAATLAVHDINTNAFVLGAAQPLLGLVGLSDRYRAANETAAAAQKAEHALEADLTARVKTGLYRLFEARATAKIAQASVQQLSDQLSVAKSRLKAGEVTNADVLRIDTAVANARQEVLQAQVAADVARQGLLTALGLPLDSDADFVEPSSLATPAPPTLTDAERLASRDRPELAAAESEARAARHQSDAARWSLAPDIDLSAAYVHLEGQVLAVKDEAYLGLQLSWAPFSWGADWYQAQAAAERAAAAEAQVEAERRSISLEVASRLSQVEAAASAVDVARTGIASAQEAYRVTKALVKFGTATTTDLLSAQAALTQAKLNLVRANYERAIVEVALERALGR